MTYNIYICHSLPSLALIINRIGQGVVVDVTVWDIGTCCGRAGLSVGQNYKAAMSVCCNKSGMDKVGVQEKVPQHTACFCHITTPGGGFNSSPDTIGRTVRKHVSKDMFLESSNSQSG